VNQAGRQAGRQALGWCCEVLPTFVFDVNSVVGLLHHVVVGDVTDVLEVHAAPIFRVKVCRLLSFFLIYSILF
jgi:hypothetical protein